MNAPMQKSRLGRGLASLIGEPAVSQPRIPPEGEQRMVPIGMIRASKNNPRKTFKDDDMVELSDSIREKVRAAYHAAGNPYMVNAGCEIPAKTSHENLRALCEPVPFER